MKTLSLIIPVYNEQKRLDITFYHLLRRFVPRGIKLQSIIFVNDGSTDSTYALLKEKSAVLSKETGAEVIIVNYKKNQGKGYAIARGMQKSRADYSLLVDADMSTPLQELSKCATLMQKGEDVIIGTRKNGHSTVTVHQPFLRESMGKVFTKLAQTIVQVSVTDFTCGFKLFSNKARKAIFNRVHIKRWGYDAEVLFLAHQLSFEIREVALVWAHDTGTKVHMLQDAANSFWELLLIRWYMVSGAYKIKKAQSFMPTYAEAIV